ncbi:DUF2497 domain-containing protein [Erythrobacter litoralis]|uniref:Pole-organizing protein PopZ n=1 Tax=Erythrobacter litoralis (strain HTCC2594) TaxID=314225 RepID=Q2N6L5_ERYLH|nr:DUF2497 domain-containing protein [Erythrobacter litoralis]ABC64676.1 hypothetical protein ELI_12920 [Erythrobacter litoralis HTCC2594]
MRQQGEASVEEILESIKKVIARDNRAGAMEARRRRESEAAADDMPEPVDDDEAEEVLELGTDAMVEDVTSEVGDHAEDSLLGDAVRDAMRDNLATLAMLAEPGARPQIVRSGETSLEGMVRDMLRPMLAEWLEKNLPGMVEDMVRNEIARIAGKRG